MLFLLLAFLGGILTILSPCILPVLPFVFARSDQPFLRNGLPLLLGMALTFALVATLAAVGGQWIGTANSIGRWLALGLMSFFALLLIFPSLSARATRPLVNLGSRLSSRKVDGAIGSSLLLGVATGLLWAPCAGPILGIILTGAAISGASAMTALLLLAYALGAATSLALALLLGSKVFAAMKRSVGAGERLRQLLGVLILGGVAIIALGLDTRVLAQLSGPQTFRIENRIAVALGMGQRNLSTHADTMTLPVEGQLPSLDGAVLWLNSPPLSREQLKGKVVLVDFWTYSCINCIRSVPYVRGWAEKYRDKGLVVIGVHAPEFAFERDSANVRKAVADFGIRYPVALDNQLIIWRAFDNQYWPAHYLADARGRIRYHHFGEGEEELTETAIRSLLIEAGATNLPPPGSVAATGVGLASDPTTDYSPETYLGVDRADGFVPEGGLGEGARDYSSPGSLALNQWTLEGRYRAEAQRIVTLSPAARLIYRFRARDLHLVMGSTTGKPLRIRVSLDGKAPGDDHGLDINADGEGVISGQRLYQLVRQKSGAKERLFTIEFLGPGAQAFAFTFG